jgi:CheY-like chemotaxis protein
VCGEAVNGKEAIDKALALNPDLVLMDISMPVMNGIEATRQIRRLSPVTKIVIVSLRDDESITAEAKNAGADAYVVKACASEILLETIWGKANGLPAAPALHTQRPAIVWIKSDETTLQKGWGTRKTSICAGGKSSRDVYGEQHNDAVDGIELVRRVFGHENPIAFGDFARRSA